MKSEFKADYHYGDLIFDPWVVERIKKTLTATKRFLNKSDNVTLDFGGYDGNLKRIHDSFGLNFIGKYTIIDGDERALDSAQQDSFNTIYYNLDEFANSSFTQKFDLIFATEVLEHLVDPKMVLSKLLDCLNDDGVLVISLPNENTLVHRIYSIFGLGIDTEAFNLYKHLHMPTLRQSKNFLSQYVEISAYENWFHFGGNNSKLEFLGMNTNGFLARTCILLGNLFPSLLARGRIYVCKKK